MLSKQQGNDFSRYFCYAAAMKNLCCNFICLLAGALLTLAFAPFYLWPLAILMPAVLLACQWSQGARSAARLGFWFGLGFFGTGASWVYVSIYVYGQTNNLLAGALTLFFVCLLSVAPTLQGLLLGKLLPKPSLAKAVIGFPATWVLSEWLRSWLFTGFPWILLGYSQSNSPLKDLAPILGTYGTSFVLCLFSGLLVFAFYRQGRPRYYSLTAILAMLLCSVSLSMITWTHPSGNPFKVSLVQGNVAQSIKWSQQQIIRSEQRYQQLSAAHWNAQLVIWPESAITVPPWYAADYLLQLSETAKKNQSSLILGLPITADDDPNFYYNGLLALGNSRGQYLKRHLVPFGEYVPLESWLRGLINFFNLPMSDLHPGPRQQALIKTPQATLAPFICYEIAYAPLVYQDAARAQLLLTLSDDSWFGHSIAASQHLQIGQWRALETGRQMLFVANSGITAIIGPQGYIRQQLPQFTQGVLTGKVQPMQGVTPILRYGQTPILLIITLLLLLTAWGSRYPQYARLNPLRKFIT